MRFEEQPEGESPICECASDPIATLKKLFVDVVMGRRAAAGQDPLMRPVFLKQHGVAHGKFVIEPGLPDELKIGLLKGSRYSAWVRFSSDTIPGKPDLNTTVGIGIKMFDVPSSDGQKSTHDFLLQNHDVFFVDTATDMCEFTHAGVVGGGYDPYLAAHPVTDQILKDMAKVVPSLVTTPYWSVIPYAFGKDRFVKYKLVPIDGQLPVENDFDDPCYLHADLRKQLLRSDVGFHFYIQFQKDPERMPLDRATVRWEESESAPIHVATLTIHAQDIDSRGQSAYGENLSFTPWHALPEHRPEGSIAQARQVVYVASADLRRHTNGIPVGEPVQPRPEAVPSTVLDRRIVRAAIHPAIGVARVGDSRDEYVIGPEVLDPPAAAPGYYRDSTGALKRQAARFRIYGYNAAGEVVGEMTTDSADVRWTVHVANKKAAWYQFQIALDIPEAPSAAPSEFRNKTVRDRASLIIDPGPRTIRGASKEGAQYAFDSGQFLGRAVYLGELQTDNKGRLLFLGGRGVSASADGSPATDFANNEGWHDDVADGPVRAEVNIGGRSIPVESAWVIVGPPNFAPNLRSARTMYDLIFDTLVQAGELSLPSPVSFTRHILPILRNTVGLQWVNAGYAVEFGWRGPQEFLRADYLARLSSKAVEEAELRRTVLNSFRNFERDGYSPVPWPWLYGDAMDVPPLKTPRQHAGLSSAQLRMLEMWAEGKFEADYDPMATAPDKIEEVPLSRQPETLDQAALEFCLADAFHPGCELTWPVRHASMYWAPFRIRARAAGDIEPNYGTRLTPEAALGAGGPLYAQGPGDLTRWMAIPWQTDTASCRAGYYAGYGPRYDPYLPTFWPARVPNHVLTEESYNKVVDSTLPIEVRRAEFVKRASWFRTLGTGDYLQQINNMVRDFGKMGLVEARPGVAHSADFPPMIEVESLPAAAGPAPGPHVGLIALHVAAAKDAADTALLARAMEESGVAPEETVAGFINKVQRFPNGIRRQD